jgi:hypothetical protein
MAYYDAYTADAANTALGRALATFSHPNDNPNINSFADANFLYGQIQTHIHTIRTFVLGSFGGAKFSMLFPSDVNFHTAYSNMVTAPIGGQLNAYVNIPPAYKTTGSDLDRLDGEALDWGTTYRTIDNAKISMALPIVGSGWSWPTADVKYFIPWQNGGCPWEEEYLQTFVQGPVALIFWALDHLILFSWKLPLPTSLTGSE